MPSPSEYAEGEEDFVNTPEVCSMDGDVQPLSAQRPNVFCKSTRNKHDNSHQKCNECPQNENAQEQVLHQRLTCARG